MLPGVRGTAACLLPTWWASWPRWESGQSTRQQQRESQGPVRECCQESEGQQLASCQHGGQVGQGGQSVQSPRQQQQETQGPVRGCCQGQLGQQLGQQPGQQETGRHLGEHVETTAPH